MEFLKVFKEANRLGITKEEFIPIWEAEMQQKSVVKDSFIKPQVLRQSQSQPIANNLRQVELTVLEVSKDLQALKSDALKLRQELEILKTDLINKGKEFYQDLPALFTKYTKDIEIKHQEFYTEIMKWNKLNGNKMEAGIISLQDAGQSRMEHLFSKQKTSDMNDKSNEFPKTGNLSNERHYVFNGNYESQMVSNRNLSNDSRQVSNGNLPNESQQVSNGNLPNESQQVSNGNLPNESQQVSNGHLPNESQQVSNGNLPNESQQVSNGHLPNESQQVSNGHLPNESQQVSNGNLPNESQQVSNGNLPNESQQVSNGNLPNESQQVSNGNLPNESQQVSNGNLPNESQQVSNGNLPNESQQVSNGNLPNESQQVSNGNLPNESQQVSNSNLPKESHQVSNVNLPKESHQVSNVNLPKESHQVSNGNLLEESHQVSNGNLLEESQQASSVNLPECQQDSTKNKESQDQRSSNLYLSNVPDEHLKETSIESRSCPNIPSLVKTECASLYAELLLKDISADRNEQSISWISFQNYPIKVKLLCYFGVDGEFHARITAIGLRNRDMKSEKTMSGLGRIKHATSGKFSQLFQFTMPSMVKIKPGVLSRVDANCCLKTTRLNHPDVTLATLKEKNFISNNTAVIAWNLNWKKSNT